MEPKLTIELVPKTCWYSNVRSEVETNQWDVLRKQCYRNAGHKCEICGGTGPKWPVECHEIWEYDDVNRVQTLHGLIALCPSCHQVTHIGLAGIQGNYDKAVKHLMTVNEWDYDGAAMYVDDAFFIWSKRSKHDWTLDITWLENENG